MDCLQIIKKYLKENGFDGLHNNGECGCEILDLVPCENNFSCCTPGYKVFPPNGEECELNFYICQSKEDKPWET